MYNQLPINQFLGRILDMNQFFKSKKSLLLLEFVLASLVFLFFSLYNPPFQQISDDRMILLQFLEKQAGQQILGASSQTEPIGCPANKPVIGWIDYAGKKQIRSQLPPNAVPSACFSSLEEALAEGFVLTD
jgi:hypothetical protein